MMGVPRRSMHLWNIYITLVFNIVGLQFSSGQLNEITFRLQEQKPYATYVGNVAVKSDIARNLSNAVFQTLTYNFLNPNSLQTASLFSINRRTGAIHTAAMIDRETVKRSDKEVCAFFAECEIEFDVTVQSQNTSFLKIITVKMIIEDINDSPPTFVPNEIKIYVSESTNAGSKIPIEGATDKDTPGRNSVQSYEITSYRDVFDVNFVHKLDGSSSLKVVVMRGLDRELKDRYQFTILAKDGGTPSLTGTLTVNVEVIDVNDNAPAFALNRYNIIVKETTAPNSVVGRVSARDSDSGKNARVLYRFSTLRTSKIEELFTLDETTGQLIVKKPLQYESGNTFEAVIEAVDKGETPQASQAILVVNIIDDGNTPPRVTLNLASSVVYSDTILLSEGSSIGTFVGRVKVEDTDPGKNGDVHCSSLDDHFSLNKLDANSFAILLFKALDRETKDKHNVTVVCSDSGSPSLSASVGFIVRVTDINDNAPVFTSRTYFANVTENINRSVNLITVKANDADMGINGEVSYSLSMEAGSMFSIDSHRGVIKANGAFDRETLNKMTFLVKAVDHHSKSRTGTATVTVNILDVNDNRPVFPPTPFKFRIPENLRTAKRVGQLTAIDKDIGNNAALQYKTLTNDPSIPFVVFSDGVIRTERQLDREIQDKYTLHVFVTDNGQPPLYSNGTVIIEVTDVNDNSPTILFPNDDNNSVILISDTDPATTFTSIEATDDDIGINAEIMFFITGGNRGNVFTIGRSTGEIRLTRSLTTSDEKEYKLTISAQDSGSPPQESQTLLIINVNYTNNTIAADWNAEKNAHTYRIIAGIVGGVTFILSILIVSIILLIRRNDNARRDTEEKMGVQEECGKREMERRIWQEVNTEDIKAGFEREKQGDKCYKPKMDKDRSFTIDPDRNTSDSFLSHAALDQYGKPEFFTFRKGHGPPFSEDVRSDASGETTTSDSGRGGSEEDIQLPPLPDLKGFSGSHQIFSVAIDENEEFSPQSTPQDMPEKSRTLSTFSNSNTANKISLPPTSSFRDIHSIQDPTFRNNQRNQPKVRFSTDSIPNGPRYQGNGKHGKFPKEFNGRTNVPIISNGEYYTKHDQSGFSHLGSYHSLPRSVEDDDNTTTSGSYTLNPDDFEEVFCER
ncbi:protocadherin beta-3-like [Haliotis rubra]|uniref:protocadherin beta-3-like n=1 Tax=Haliotis rubra TaxID=36100 RepID=UPI001EE5435A|nr:protocadherin beta-3-like [Haliotis rubra]XP_046555873.1 protocadherin beta-3-like [Haliotis rubra]XP_046555880.1 protocadherin beta-3-like [Haliotis rubra]